MATHGARAAAGDAGGRVPRRRVTRHGRAPCACVSPKPERNRLCREQERRDRISLGGGQIRSISSPGGRSSSSSGERDCRVWWHACGTGGKGGDRNDSDRLPTRG